MGKPVNNLKESFDTIAAGYDEDRRLIIPDFSGFYAAAVRATASPKESPSVLDIGAGTGLLSEMLLEACPEARITLMDISEKMLGVARERFAGRRNVRFIVADYRYTDLGGPFNVICSALSIHHLEREEKRVLYRSIFESLEEGGTFVNADEVAGETAEEHQKNLAYWDDFLLSGPLGEEGAREIIRRRESLDLMEKLSVQLAWMSEAGFASVRVVYKNRAFSVFTGRRYAERASPGTLTGKASWTGSCKS